MGAVSGGAPERWRERCRSGRCQAFASRGETANHVRRRPAERPRDRPTSRRGGATRIRICPHPLPEPLRPGRRRPIVSPSMTDLTGPARDLRDAHGTRILPADVPSLGAQARVVSSADLRDGRCGDAFAACCVLPAGGGSPASLRARSLPDTFATKPLVRRPAWPGSDDLPLQRLVVPPPPPLRSDLHTL